MISEFNLVEIKSWLKDFFVLTKIRAVVFNDRFRELGSYPEEHAPLCRLMRSDPEALKQCTACDREACVTAKSRRSIYIYKCHAGLTEAIVPIVFNNIHTGYLFLGQIFSFPDHETGWLEIESRCNTYHIDMDVLKSVCFGLPIISEKYIHSASNILKSIAYYICLEQLVVLREQDLSVQIDNYIVSRLTEDIGVQSICDHFHIGKTFLYTVSKQIYGTGIAGYIRGLRIGKAKKLLTEQPEIHAKEVSFACGFKNYDYFIALFKKATGVSPIQYRNTKTAVTINQN
jgi:ligand-binding sensor protein